MLSKEKKVQPTSKSGNAAKPIVSGSLRVKSTNCVNSKWIAYWLANPKQECCQCGFECKIRVYVGHNGHEPYEYIVTEKEYNKLLKELPMVSNDR